MDIQVKTMLMGLLTIIGVAMAAKCPHQYSDIVYKELGCTPTYDASGCPTSYNCGEAEKEIAKKEDPDHCYHDGKLYSPGEVVPNINVCSRNCRCVLRTAYSLFIHCAIVEDCPPKRSPAPGCRLITPSGECCPQWKCLDKEQPTFTCKHNNHTYMSDEHFNNYEECLDCQCSEGFTGVLEKPYCSPINCHLNSRFDKKILSNCAPVFSTIRGCCPTEFRCPKAGDKIIQSQEPRLNTTDKCKFGTQEIAVNDSVNTGETNLECKCVLPPYLTCVLTEHQARYYGP